MVDVLTTGEALGCLRADGWVQHGTSARLSVAGAESNVAIGLSRLGHVARWVGVVGTDQLGALVRRTLVAEGVDISQVRVDAAPTGIVLFEQRLAGLVREDYHRLGSAGSRLCPEDLVDAFTPVPRMLHVTGLTMALGDAPAEAVRAAVRLARQHGTTVCLDVNHRSRLWTADQARTALAALSGNLDIVFASDDELPLVAPAGADVRAGAESLLERGASQVVVTHGADGATVYTIDGALHAPARPVRAVDTVAPATPSSRATCPGSSTHCRSRSASTARSPSARSPLQPSATGRDSRHARNSMRWTCRRDPPSGNRGRLHRWYREGCKFTVTALTRHDTVPP